MAVDVVNFCKWLMYEKKEFIMSKQLLRSGTSIGANIHEAHYAISKADFISKMQIALKEASETEYWLIVLQSTGYFDERFAKLPELCSALVRMLTSTLNTAKTHQAEELSSSRKKKSTND
ncbi:MAG: four helix bundle protein [Faecousia sp.]